MERAVPSPRPAIPAADTEDASWREKQQRLAEARARLLAAKRGEAPEAAPSAPPPVPLPEEAAPLPDEASLAAIPPTAERATTPAAAPPPSPGALHRKLANELADELGEIHAKARHCISVLLRRRGEAFMREHVAKAREVEASGGMPILNGERRRSFGGVFFFLARQTIGTPVWLEMFPPFKKKRRGPVETPKAETPPPDPAAAKRIQPGEARTVKVTLVGRPGAIAVRDTCIETTMENRKVPDFPKGLPAPPKEPTRWRVFIAKKQWSRVESALAADPTDALVIEAWGALDASCGIMTAYAMNVTTMLIQRAAKAAKPAPATT